MPANGNDEGQRLFGTRPAEVLAAIRARARARAAGGAATTDGRKLALVIEGGGMRGVCSGGGVVALDRMGLSGLFDEVYGTSAGVMNASYFLAGQAALGIRIYYEHLVRREIVNPLRPWKIFDIDRVFDRVVTTQKPLDVDAVLRSPSKLFVAMIDVARAEPIVVDVRASASPLLTLLKAATAIPVLYNRVVTVDDRPCVDAGLMKVFPLADAIAAGCTDILVLATRPGGYRRPAPRAAEQWLFDRLFARGNPALSRIFARHHERDAGVRDLALGRTPAPDGVNIATICTHDTEVVQRLTRDPARLHAAASAYGRATLRLFEADLATWDLAPPEPAS